MESQNKKILKHLKAGKTITSYEALMNFGCFRLAARIASLRGKGHNIKTNMVTHTDGKRFAQYILIE